MNVMQHRLQSIITSNTCLPGTDRVAEASNTNEDVIISYQS